MKSKRILSLIIALLLAAYVAVGMSGCGGKENAASRTREQSGQAQSPAKEAVSASDPSGENDAASSASDDAPEGEPAADITVYTAAGEAVRLSDLRGQPVIVNFFATWCPPCKAELPDFDSAAARYGDRIRFLIVDLVDGYSETVAGAQQFMEENGYSFPLYFDMTGEAADAYDVSGIPTTLAVDAEGRLAYTHVGMLNASEVEALVNSLLG